MVTCSLKTCRCISSSLAPPCPAAPQGRRSPPSPGAGGGGSPSDAPPAPPPPTVTTPDQPLTSAYHAQFMASQLLAVGHPRICDTRFLQELASDSPPPGGGGLDKVGGGWTQGGGGGGSILEMLCERRWHQLVEKRETNASQVMASR